MLILRKASVMSENNSGKKEYVPNHWLRQAREERGWTLEEVARRINLPDAQMVGRWERGIHRPQPHHRRMLCELFGKSPQELGLISERKLETPMLALPGLSEAIWHVPAKFSTFVGREQEIARIQALFARPDVRLITLSGPGGVGKTRLAIQVAEAMRGSFVQGACFVSLEAILDPGLLWSALAKELGIQQYSKGSGIRQDDDSAVSLEELVCTSLGSRQLLLILDNFEQIVAAAPQLEHILEACPYLKMLVTSRESLRISAEQEFPVAPLPLPDLSAASSPEVLLRQAAVELFIQRTRAILPDFDVDESNARIVAEICTHLDGLPLAIELAAARMKLLTLPSLLERLSHRLRLLKSDGRTTPDRQKTLYNTIRWSYDLLSKDEQWLFRRLAIFTGSFSLQTVERLFGNERLPDIVDVTDSLLDKSLLQRNRQQGEEDRLTLLETMREYGQELLRERGELVSCQRAHALYYLDLVEEAKTHLTRALQRQWLGRLDQELNNLRAALNWFIEQQMVDEALRFCDAFGKFCGLRGYWSEEQRWLAAALELAQRTDTTSNAYAPVLRRAGYLAYRLRDLRASRSWLEESVQLSRASGDRVNLAGALSNLGRTLARQKESAWAERLLRESVEVARASRDDWSLANALDSLGRFLYYHGNIDEAQRLLEESIALTRITEDRESLSRILTTLVDIEIALGRLDDAAALATESLFLARELGTRPVIALALDCMGQVALFRCDYERAVRLFHERIQIAHGLGDTPTVAREQLPLGEIALAQANYEQAMMLVQNALDFFQAQDDSPGIALALGILGNIACNQGRFDEAQSYYRDALSLDDAIGRRGVTGMHLAGLARVACSQGALEASAQLLGYAATLIHPQRDMIPLQREAYEQTQETVRQQLASERFEQAWRVGENMTLEQALALLGHNG
jgi:predicted ATPase/DNA-binding transcriptional regulator YiaG